jgi:DNA (cytosine-5)-methyltransferase 1
MNELSLFAGAGGGILGGKLLGWRTVCAVEINDYCRRVLMQRQDDGILAPFPIWDDVRTFDGKPWRGVVDVVSGGFPCQDISAAGKGAGITGERSGLWREMARIVGEVRPRFVFVENSPLLISRGIGVVLGDFAAMGYDARWGVVSAADAIWIGGTPCLDHLRNRVWVLATLPDSQGKQGGAGLCEDGTEHNGNQPANMGATSYSERERQSGPWKHGYAVHSTAAKEREANYPEYAGWWQSEPALGRVANGVANRVDRLTAIGNGQVSSVAKLAWNLLA